MLLRSSSVDIVSHDIRYRKAGDLEAREHSWHEENGD